MGDVPVLDRAAGWRGWPRCELAIAEGAMGLFDGVANGGQSGSGSAADVAAMLGWPVVLVIDVSGQAETAAAVALGCMKYPRRCDRCRRHPQPRRQRKACGSGESQGLNASACRARRFYARGRVDAPERHLGLVQAVETGDLDRRLDALARRAELALDLEAVAGCARGSRQLLDSDVSVDVRLQPARSTYRGGSGSSVHVLLSASRAAMAQAAAVTAFAPTTDESPPEDADAVWLPGGYPELHAGAHLPLRGGSRMD